MRDLPYKTPEPTALQQDVARRLRSRGRTLGDQLVAAGQIQRPSAPASRVEPLAPTPARPAPTR